MGRELYLGAQAGIAERRGPRARNILLEKRKLEDYTLATMNLDNFKDIKKENDEIIL